MYRLLRPFVGEYTIRLREENILPFLHRLSVNHVLFRNLRKEEDGWSVKTTLSAAEPLLANAIEAGIKAEIVSKRGIPFLAARYKKRPGLLLGLLLGLGLIFYAELFVWKITVNGNTLLSDEEIIEALEDYGIGVGSFIPKIPVLRAQNEFLIEYRDISSIAINIKGTHIQVEVLERTHAPEIEQKDGYYNVVAAEDAIIISIDVAAGTALVKPGDVVTEGQPLISAFTVGTRNIYHLHHARGNVIAQVYGTYSVAVPLTSTVKQYTGREETKTTLTVLGKDFDLFLSENSPFEQFDAEVQEKPFYLFGIAETPIVKTTAVYREYTSKTVALTHEQAKKDAEDAFSDWLAKQTDEVLEYDVAVTYDEIQNAYVLNASVVFQKNIGLDMPLAPGELPPEQVKPPIQQ